MMSGSISKLSKIKQNENIKEGRFNKKNISKYSKVLGTIIKKSTVVLTCLKSLNLDLFALKIISIIFILLSMSEIVLNFISTQYKS